MKKIGIIAPSGNIENFDKNRAVEFFKKYNMEAVVFPSCFEKFRYMAGSDDLRISDIHNAFLDTSIDTIMCARGGYGALRLLDKIDYNIIKENKKTFIGFSDITLLLIAFYKKAGLNTFHGKMAANGVLNMEEEEFLKYKNLIENPFYKTSLTGGVLWGGNLASIVSLFGSDNETYIPNEDIILFVEDINEPDYKIDRMFTQIVRNKHFRDKIKGVIFGEFIGSSKFLDEIKLEFARNLKVPFEVNLNITHGNLNTVVPFGLRV